MAAVFGDGFDLGFVTIPAALFSAAVILFLEGGLTGFVLSLLSTLSFVGVDFFPQTGPASSS